MMFLSQLLSRAERYYWPTKLEIAGLVWSIQKLCHFVKLSKHKIMMQTNHAFILNIGRQKDITATSSSMRLNVCLIQASQYFSQFNFDVKHKLGKLNIVLNALNCLSSKNTLCVIDNTSDYNELDALNIYNKTLVEMSETLAKNISDGYNKNKA